jgi:hypothetical protein
VSSFRLIYMALLTAAIAGFAAGAAAAQSPTAADQSSKPYLAGLRPPHEHHKPAHAKTSHVSAQRKATTKMARPATKRRPIVEANSKAHRPARLADKINSRVAWPSAEPAATDERASSETVLQFATEETAPAPAAPPHRPIPASTTSTVKTAPPAKIATTDERENVDSAAVDKPPAASTLVQTERYQAPDQNETLPAATPREEMPKTDGQSATAQMLVTLAGAIAAGIIAWLIFGFGSLRVIKSRQI